MKRILFVALLLLAAALTWAGGQTEGAEPSYELILVNTGTTPWDVVEHPYDTGGYPSFQHKIVGEFQQAHPNIRVNLIIRDVTQGSMTVDALMAKGTPPDVWLDAAGYFRSYLNADYALPLEQYMDVSAYREDLVAPYTRDGHVYALPMVNVATGLAVNLSMLKEIGYTLPPTEQWTTDEFLVLAERLKAAGYPAIMIMTKGGLISWDMAWLYAFGGELFKPGDYSKVTINTPEARAGLEYMKLLVDRGYSWPYPNETDDDMGVDLFTTGKVFACVMQNGHSDYWIPEQVKQGALKEAFDYTFVEVPHAPGRAHTPVYSYQTCVIAKRSADEGRNKAVAALLQTQAGAEYQQYCVTMQGAFPTLKDFEIPDIGTAKKPSYKAIAKLAPVAGQMDLGGMHPRVKEVNAAWKIPIQEFMEGKITAQQVLDRFEAEANKVLAAK